MMSPGSTGAWRPFPDQPAFVRFIGEHYDEWLALLLQRRVPRTDAEELLDEVLHDDLAPDPTFDPDRAGANAYVRKRLNWRASDYQRSPRSQTISGVGVGGKDGPGKGLADR